MDIIDRYLDTVRLLLPAAERDDITAELRDVLMNRREEKEAELGRPVTKQEDEALLRAFGNPLLVAARYVRPRYLIGPDLYPAYVLVMKVVLAVIAAAAVIVGVVMGALNPDNLHHAVRTAIDTLFNGGLGAVGWVTIVFWALQHTGFGERMLRDWKIEDLPRIDARGFSAARRRRQRGWPEFVAAIAFQCLFLLWWTGALPVWWANLPVEPHGLLQIAPAPIWRTLYVPIVLLSSATIGVNATKLAGVRGRMAHGLDIAINIAVMALATIALRAGHWVAITGVGIAPDKLAQVQYGVEIGLRVSLIAVIVSGVVQIGVALWQIARPAAQSEAHAA